MKETEKKFTFSKKERITGDKRIEMLFTKGSGFISYPLRIIYLMNEENVDHQCSVLISVPKKRLKKATDRNRIKRLIRESYRLNKSLLDNTKLSENSIDIAFVYVKDTKSDFPDIQKAMQKALKKISLRTIKTDESE